MKMLSVGMPSTLGSYLRLSRATLGDDSPATAFLRGKIAEQGEDEEVLADEGQMLYLLAHLHLDEAKPGPEGT